MKNQPYRLLLIAVGSLAVLCGVAGIFLPLVPTTPFLLVALWCFSRASPRLHAWLIHHQRLGPVITLWQERGAIPTNAKIVAVILICFSLISIWVFVPLVVVKTMVSLGLVVVSVFILTRPGH